MECWDAIVGIVTKLRSPGNGFPNMTEAVYFYALQNMHIDTVVYPDSYAIGTGDSFPGFKRAV
jgi:hypothetical protein